MARPSHHYMRAAAGLRARTAERVGRWVERMDAADTADRARELLVDLKDDVFRWTRTTEEEQAMRAAWDRAVERINARAALGQEVRDEE